MVVALPVPRDPGYDRGSKVIRSQRGGHLGHRPSPAWAADRPSHRECAWHRRRGIGAHNGARMQDQLRHLLEKDRIIDTINQLFIGTDSRDWPTVRACFADMVHFDMTSLSGGSASHLTPEQIAAGWEADLRQLQAIHHQVGTYRVKLEGEEATAFCYGTATHYRPTRSGRNTRTFVGSYDFHLRRVEDRWQIDRLRFSLKYMEGNAELGKGV